MRDCWVSVRLSAWLCEAGARRAIAKPKSHEAIAFPKLPQTRWCCRQVEVEVEGSTAKVIRGSGALTPLRGDMERDSPSSGGGGGPAGRWDGDPQGRRRFTPPPPPAWERER
jgi:hypothetical protein